MLMSISSKNNAHTTVLNQKLVYACKIIHTHKTNIKILRQRSKLFQLILLSRAHVANYFFSAEL
jgi:hypothetical protein